MTHHGEVSVTGLLLLASALGLPLLCYRLAVDEANRRHGSWPVWRTGCWVAGLGALAIGLLPGQGFLPHMVSHLLVGMVAPLLFALAAPVELALRALSVERARALVRVLRAAPVRTLGHPVTAAVLNVGGLWLLYLTPLYPVLSGHPLLHVHLLVAGYLFAAAILGTHPRPAGYPLRAAVLVGYLAAHGVLAKYLYGHPPAGVSAADAELGAQLMYYGGDAVDLVLIVLLCRAWFRTLDRREPLPVRS
ncbi:cytochrome c oxidase assembly protein [Cryptosporangium aurantiacum]|uniref:Putative membrane protein n=1 Tax=Cryptosporangium aurantiacum TaxID=134849 RepID=A0A1M7JU68_9ACTN|nr:cytochrome c oxidase assembly protein [Cryptosporangium aurantiacum]SHM56592.1 putative membrane protein [Cryptosporangium aurantiacum]